MTENDKEPLGTCSIGAGTALPCRRTAIWQDGQDGPRFCERHLQLVWTQELVSEIERMLHERLEAMRDWADSPQ